MPVILAREGSFPALPLLQLCTCRARVRFLAVPCQSDRVMDAGPSTRRKHQRSTESRDENLTMQGNHIDGEATNLMTGRELPKRGGGL